MELTSEQKRIADIAFTREWPNRKVTAMDCTYAACAAVLEGMVPLAEVEKAVIDGWVVGDGCPGYRNLPALLRVIRTIFHALEPVASCEYCGPACYGGAAHNARVEDKAFYKAPAEASSKEVMKLIEKRRSNIPKRYTEIYAQCFDGQKHGLLDKVLIRSLIEELGLAEACTETLRLEGHAGSPIWAMEEADGIIGLRLDCGDAGMVRLTIPQAKEVINALQFQIASATPVPASAGEENVLERMKRVISDGLGYRDSNHNIVSELATAALREAERSIDAEWELAIDETWHQMPVHLRAHGPDFLRKTRARLASRRQQGGK